MRLINIEEYDADTMQLARPVYDKHKRVLLAAGRTIHPTFLERLEDVGIRYLMVEDSISEGITMEEIVDASDWMEAIEVIQHAFEEIKNKGAFPMIEIQQLAGRLITEITNRKAVVLFPTSSLQEELREYAHAVNVALLSVHLAKKKQLPPKQLRDLAIGALLHDIGKWLTKELNDHPKAGFNFLRGYREISLLSAHIAYQHHEKADGTGFPRGIKKEEIHEFAQICSIANMYDHLLSNEAVPPHEAMEYIMTQVGSTYSNELVRLFVDEVPSYIPGTQILLNNGKEAIVTKIIGSMQRPYIRYLETGEEFSLVENPTVLISKVLSKN